MEGPGLMDREWMDLTGTSWGAQLRNSGVRAQGDRGTGSLGTIRGSIIARWIHERHLGSRYMHFTLVHDTSRMYYYPLFFMWLDVQPVQSHPMAHGCPCTQYPAEVCLSVCRARFCPSRGSRACKCRPGAWASGRLGGRSLVQIAWREVRIRQPGACEREGKPRKPSPALPWRRHPIRLPRSSPEEAPVRPNLFFPVSPSARRPLD